MYFMLLMDLIASTSLISLESEMDRRCWKMRQFLGDKIVMYSMALMDLVALTSLIGRYQRWLGTAARSEERL